MPADQRRWRELGNELLAELRRLSAVLLGIQEQIEAVSEQHQAQNQREQAPPVLRAELQIPEAIVKEWKYDSDKKNRHERFAIWVSVVTLLALNGYVIFTYEIWQEATVSSNASLGAVAESRSNRHLAEKSLDATIDQFRLDQRAWLGPIEPFPPNIAENNRLVYLKEGAKYSLRIIAGI